MASSHTPSSSASAEHDTAAEHQSHHVPGYVYWRTYWVLMVLLILTVVMYDLDLSNVTHWVGTNLIIALVIAVAKAALVVLFFMNVKYSSKLTWLWAALGFIWLFLMAGIFLDYTTRGWTAPTGWQH